MRDLIIVVFNGTKKIIAIKVGPLSANDCIFNKLGSGQPRRRGQRSQINSVLFWVVTRRRSISVPDTGLVYYCTSARYFLLAILLFRVSITVEQHNLTDVV